MNTSVTPREKGRRVVVAMSGGVDSSVAAMLLKDAGYDVIGLMMRLWSAESAGGAGNRCCTPQGVDDARQVAAILDIPFYLVDYSDAFKSTVVDYFIAEYSHGRTPNPCVVCNRQIRFTRLLQQALGLGAEYLATGHYARIDHDGQRYRLLRGIDPAKDQSYVLHVLTQEHLSRLLFPLGKYLKPAVREMARARGLPVAEKAESQDICFLPDGDYRPFIAERASAGLTPGPILNAEGKTLAQHQGIALYTVGQRHGLGLATGAPLYVTSIDALRNALIVGPAGALPRRTLTVSGATYVAGSPPAPVFACAVRLRYKASEHPATVTAVAPDRARIDFEQPQKPVSPGQSAVFYAGDDVLGGGVID